jgi:hypothetical protein
LANKRKVAGARKADRKERNLPRLIRKYIPAATVTEYASERIQGERTGTNIIPVIVRNTVGDDFFATRGVIRNATRVQALIREERASKSQAAKRSSLPRPQLPDRQARILRLCHRFVMDADQGRREMQLTKACQKTGFVPSALHSFVVQRGKKLPAAAYKMCSPNEASSKCNRQRLKRAARARARKNRTRKEEGGQSKNKVPRRRTKKAKIRSPQNDSRQGSKDKTRL